MNEDVVCASEILFPSLLQMPACMYTSIYEPHQPYMRVFEFASASEISLLELTPW